MSFWDGNRWVEPVSLPPSAPNAISRWAATAVMIFGLCALVAPLGLMGAATHRPGSSGCAVYPTSADVGENYVVSAWGLPTGTAINLWVTEGDATTGSPLGGTPDGTFNLNESSATAGVTTYTFSGPTRPNMKVYGSCSVSAY